MIEKASKSDADLVFMDLEDSVAPSKKVESRENVVDALHNLDWGIKTVAVRVNGLHSPYCYGDIVTLAERGGDRLDILIVPKTKSAEHVRWVDTLLTQIEANTGSDRRIGIEVLIEEVEAMICVEEIARASPRLEALIFGPGDYSASQGVNLVRRPVPSHDSTGAGIYSYAKNKVVIAARAAGIQAIDGPCAVYQEVETYTREAEESMRLGFSGKWAIHPRQIEPANTIFSPSPAEVDDARRRLDAYAAALAAGEGAVAFEGEMMDAAMVRGYEDTLAFDDAVKTASQPIRSGT